ncbi:hypothetical protein ABL78_3617 [Leptomonas seymouri]|uniref:TatD related DNase n=1 Tax=Leptomonas seymouri TaxID=5684 RepID=A0A0N1PEL6_LEPSE|nr:hypothetical protein ABL78_3617 [Leptomonas seymouri]|eukprot:KPI87280.1 hypothetical protein ABL78_3617 [Leptomonas seymouri]
MHRTKATKAVYDFLYDSHCHLREVALCGAEGKASASSSSALDAVRSGVTHLVLCGTHPQIDWDLVEKAIPRSDGVQKISGFGVHPWFVPAFQPQSSAAAVEEAGGGCCSGAPVDAPTPLSLSLSLSEMLTALEQRLCTYPHAIVAEIGLDKLRGPPEAIQKEAFIAQLRLAAAHQRPVSVHCVRHYGLLMQILQDLPAADTPPAIILHAFTGSMEVAKSLLNLKNKKRTQPMLDTGAEPAEAEQTEMAMVPALTQLTDGKESTGTPAQQFKKKTKRGGVISADTVRIKERIFFGVGLSTSFTVKNFSTQTLPFLLSARRVLLETDEHYSAERCMNCDGGAAACSAESYVYVGEQEHVAQLSEVMHTVEVAAMQSGEFAKTAQESGLAPEAMARQSVVAAYADAFRSVLR